MEFKSSNNPINQVYYHQLKYKLPSSKPVVIQRNILLFKKNPHNYEFDTFQEYVFLYLFILPLP
jgi:hypothetical protein